jgi:hypothetical protein
MGTPQSSATPLMDTWRSQSAEHVLTLSRAMISFVGEGYCKVLKGEAAARMRHFATAFLGYSLQGRLDYAQYFLKDFVSPQFADLAWGVYTAN